MTDTQNVTNIKKDTVSAADQVRDEIIAVAAKASADDKKRVAEIIARAKTGKFSSETFVITPPMAAIFFLEHNTHNRDWRAEGLRSCREYARRMTAGLWMRNNATIGFYVDGELADGGHRLSAAAIAGHTLETCVVFGIEREAIPTVDDGLARHGADHAKLSGILETSTKQTIVKITAAYLVKVGDKSAALKSEAEVFKSIVANNTLLDEALEIGKGSLQNIVDPVFKAAAAQTLAYLMLTHGWPPQRIREKLALFQTGIDMDGENTPYFVACKVIKDARRKAENKDRLSTAKELGVAIYALVNTERGAKAITKEGMRKAVKKDLPNPAYPVQQQQAAE